MNILKYLFSKSYRNKFKYQYTKDMCSKLASEEIQKQEIYNDIFSNGANI